MGGGMVFLLNLANSTLTQIFVFGVFFMGLYYFSFYDDGELLKKDIQTIKDQTQTVQGNIEKTKTEIDNVLVFKNEVETKEEVVKALLNYTPESLTFNEVSTLLNNEALAAGVNIESKKDGSIDDVEDADYQTLSLEIEMTSSFSQLMFFLSKLTQQKRILIVESIDVKMDPSKNIVSSRINLLAYRYQEPEPEENQEQDDQGNV